jgi:hypothetical protein
MKLKEYLEQVVKDSPLKSFDLLKKCIELESIENWLNVMYGIDLDITVVPTAPREGRYYGQGIIDKVK